MGATLKEIACSFADTGLLTVAKRVGWWQETDPYDYHVTRYFYNTRLTILTDAAGGTSLTIAGLAPGYGYGARDHVLVTEDASSWLRGSTGSGTEIPARAESVTLAVKLRPNTSYYVWLVNNGSGSDQFATANVTVSVTGSYGTAGVPSADDGSFGQALPIRVSGQSAGAKLTVKVSCAGRSETLLSLGSASSLTWTPAVSVYAPLVKNAASAPAVITVETWYGEAKLYTRTKSVTLRWAPGTLPPSLASGWASAAPLNEGSAAGMTVWIQRFSKARVSFDPAKVTPRYGATLSAFSVTLDGVTTAAVSNRADTAVIGTTSASLLCTVTDSRGQTASQTLAVTLHPYARPALSAVSLFRCSASGERDEDGTCVSVKATVTYSACGGQNACSMSVQRRVPGGSWSSAVALGSGTARILSGLSPDSSYEFRISASDSLGGAAVYTQTLPTRLWAMKFRPNGQGVAFGKAAEHDKALELPADWSLRLGGEELLSDTGWVRLTVSAPFQVYGGIADYQPQFRRIGPLVCLRGVISPSEEVAASGSSLFFATLPAQARPRVHNFFICQATPNAHWSLHVSTSGQLGFSRYGTTAISAAPAGAWLPFSVCYLI